MSSHRHTLIVVVAVVLALLVAAGGFYMLQRSGNEPGDGLLGRLFANETLPEGFASSNGRIEATEVDVASKLAGRLTEVRAREGDRIEADSIVARLDIESLAAQSRQANAELNRARQDSEHARAVVAQRESELDFVRRDFRRLQRLSTQNQYVSEESLDQARTAVRTAEAALRAARVQVAATEAAIEAAQASIERIAVDVDDSALQGNRQQIGAAEPRAPYRHDPHPGDRGAEAGHRQDDGLPSEGPGGRSEEGDPEVVSVHLAESGALRVTSPRSRNTSTRPSCSPGMPPRGPGPVMRSTTWTAVPEGLRASTAYRLLNSSSRPGSW